MQPYEFLEYLPTPGEKQLGIATVRAWGKIILKFKIVPGKDGQGFFPSPSSIKTGIGADGKDTYEKVFLIDSQYENQQIEKLIRASINPYAQQAPSFGHQGAIMTPPNQPYQYHQQTQPDPFKQGIPSANSGGTCYANGQPLQQVWVQPESKLDGNFPIPRNPPVSTINDPF